MSALTWLARAAALMCVACGSVNAQLGFPRYADDAVLKETISEMAELVREVRSFEGSARIQAARQRAAARRDRLMSADTTLDEDMHSAIAAECKTGHYPLFCSVLGEPLCRNDSAAARLVTDPATRTSTQPSAAAASMAPDTSCAAPKSPTAPLQGEKQ